MGDEDKPSMWCAFQGSSGSFAWMFPTSPPPRILSLVPRAVFPPVSSKAETKIQRRQEPESGSRTQCFYFQKSAPVGSAGAGGPGSSWGLERRGSFFLGSQRASPGVRREGAASH